MECLISDYCIFILLMAIDGNMTAMIELLQDLIPYLEQSDSTLWATSEPKELIEEINGIIEQLKQSNIQDLKEMKIHFLPTGSLQEISMHNNWDGAYLELASRFDSLYHRIINAKPGKSLVT